MGWINKGKWPQEAIRRNGPTNKYSYTARRSYATAVLGVVILSIYLSVRLSVTRVLCDKTKQCSADILILHETAISLVCWHQQCLVGDAPSVWNMRSKWTTNFENRRIRQTYAYNVSTVRDNEKNQLWRIGSRPRAFQRAIDGVSALPISPQREAHETLFLVCFK